MKTTLNDEQRTNNQTMFVKVETVDSLIVSIRNILQYRNILKMRQVVGTDKARLSTSEIDEQESKQNKIYEKIQCRIKILSDCLNKNQITLHEILLYICSNIIKRSFD